MSFVKERRAENRKLTKKQISPVSFILVCNEKKSELEVVNYHHRGGSFRLPQMDPLKIDEMAYLIVKIGIVEQKEKIKFRLVWDDIANNGSFGVQFLNEQINILERADRFASNRFIEPVVSSQDPLDPNRIIYFKVLNISQTGVLLSTSFANKHLLPGMELRAAVLEVPTIGKTEIDLFLENSRLDSDKSSVLFGATVKGFSQTYNDLMSKYVTQLGVVQNEYESYDTKNSNKQLPFHKNLKQFLTITEIENEEEYKAVLKLRHKGYKSAGKVNKEKTWEEMGEGLEKEGIILGAYLNSKLVGCVEIRFNSKHGLKTLSNLKPENIKELRSAELAEANRLVVHPSFQKSDIVLGLFQKIHTLCMMNGQPDGVIAAEDRLVPLYKKIGFRLTTTRYPHPVKPNTFLNLMVVYKETYVNLKGINSFLWAMAFEKNHVFLETVGLTSQSSRGAFFVFRKVFWSAVIKFYGFFRGLRASKKVKDDLDQTNVLITKSSESGYVDPKWTSHELNATVMYPYILESIDIIGMEATKRILFQFGLQVSYFKVVTNWISLEFFDEYIEAYKKIADPYQLNRRAAFRNLTKEVLGTNYYLLKHFATPSVAIKAFEKLFPKFNKTRVCKISNMTNSSCTVRFYNINNLISRHDSTKENFWAAFEAYILNVTGKPGKIISLKSSFSGDLFCEFKVIWSNNILSFKNLFQLSFLSSAVFGFFWFFYSVVSFKENALALYGISFAGLLFWTVIRSANSRHKYLDLNDSMSEYEKQADLKYKELQHSKQILEKSYQEGKLLEKINREIQQSDDVISVLNTSLTNICKNFGFKRAFIMLIDENRSFLKTAAISGENDEIKDMIWAYKINVQVKRESPLVISSVFRSGQSVMINNLSEHVYQLSEASRLIIDRLKTNAFCIVPIPSVSDSWGVLLADKGELGKEIDRRDLVAIQRICQSIGLALDKQAKLETEIKIRKIFEKYVPSSVLNDNLGKKESKLGGESKNVFCMFVDIRNFTSISMTIQEKILVDILNKIFSALHDSIVQSGGIIDKFLGDGALVTWGAVTDQEIDATKIMESVKVFSEKIKIINKAFGDSNLPMIELGMGLSYGPVIVGNIGAKDRLEYTVIGSTVNLASRLEQLSKSLDVNFVISESVFNKIPKLASEFQRFENVRVRGLKEQLCLFGKKIIYSESETLVKLKESA